MNLSQATNNQLISITNYDRECPRELMIQVVNEMLNRNLFKNLIFHSTKGYQFYDLDHDDIEQVGNIAIWKAMNVYKAGKASFSSLAQAVLRNQLGSYFEKRMTYKRQSMTFSLSLDGIEHDFIPDETNVERYVVHRIYFEQQIGKLTPMQKAAVLGFMKGYEMKEIGEQLGKTRQSVERSFHTAVEKMGGGKISLRSNCGVKGAYMIKELCQEAFKTAKSKGWHDTPIEIGTLLALIHSEVSEALEADRKGDADNFVEELADVCIRVFDLCGWLNLDLEKAIREKMEKNKTRPYKHGGKAY